MSFLITHTHIHIYIHTFIYIDQYIYIYTYQFLFAFFPGIARRIAKDYEPPEGVSCLLLTLDLAMPLGGISSEAYNGGTVPWYMVGTFNLGSWNGHWCLSVKENGVANCTHELEYIVLIVAMWPPIKRSRTTDLLINTSLVGIEHEFSHGLSPEWRTCFQPWIPVTVAEKHFPRYQPVRINDLQRVMANPCVSTCERMYIYTPNSNTRVF